MPSQPSLRPNPRENKYQLTRDFDITIMNERIVVPIYFLYDGASIPAAAWQLTFSPYHPDVMQASLIHDWLFYNHQVDREMSDEIFYRLLKNNGVSNLKANMMWAAVRAAGGLFWDNDDEDKDMLRKLRQKISGRPNFELYQFPDDID